MFIKSKQVNIRDPVKNADGSVDFWVVASTDEPDRDGEIVNPMGISGWETAVVAYNHSKCNGLPAHTGSDILTDTVEQTPAEAAARIKVKPTDQMYFCDDGTGKKQSNGVLLDAILRGEVKSASIGYYYDRADVRTIFKNGRRFTYYDKTILGEISLLDTLSSNPKTIIHKSMNVKNKCLCEATAGGYAMSLTDGSVVKLISQDDQGVWTGKDFEGKDVVLDGENWGPVMAQPMDSGEDTPAPDKTPDSDPEPTDKSTEKKPDEGGDNTKVPQTPPATGDKACSCMGGNKGKEEKAPEDAPAAMGDTSKLDTILANQAKIMDMLTKLEGAMATKSDLQTQAAEQTKTVKTLLADNTLQKFAKEQNSKIQSTSFSHKI